MPAPKRSPTTFMPSISGPSMIDERPLVLAAGPPRRPASMKSTMPVIRACLSRSSTGASRQARSLVVVLLALLLDRLGELGQPVGGVGPAVEQDVLDPLEQVLGDLLVDLELAGVDDPHVEPGLDRVVEERGVHRLADRVVAAVRERDVADAAARSSHSGKTLLELADGLDELDRVVVVLLDPGADGQDVGVEDDVATGRSRPPRSGACRPARRSRPCGRR